MPLHKSWSILSIGLLLIAACSLLFFLFLFSWEKRLNNYLNDPILDPIVPIDKENKVTSLDLDLLYDYSTVQDQEKSKETVKELSLVQASLKECEAKMVLLQEELAEKEQEYKASMDENKQLVLKAQQVSQDFSDYKLFSEEQLKQKNLQLAALQQIIEDQRTEVEKRQEQIHQLDTKIHDLSYEIKTLLYLNETDANSLANVKIEEPTKSSMSAPLKNPFISISQPNFEEEIWEEADAIPAETQIRTSTEAAVLLRKCINIAQKLTGANYYSNETTRFREFSTSHYTIDQRRLFDSLRCESSGLVLVYSQKEHKLLFANNQTRQLLGCSPEKFVNDFASYIPEGMNDWKKALGQLTTASESHARLLAKTKQGNEVILNCHFGVIPTGLFRNFVVGVLYPT